MSRNDDERSTPFVERLDAALATVWPDMVKSIGRALISGAAKYGKLHQSTLRPSVDTTASILWRAALDRRPLSRDEIEFFEGLGRQRSLTMELDHALAGMDAAVGVGLEALARVGATVVTNQADVLELTLAGCRVMQVIREMQRAFSAGFEANRTEHLSDEAALVSQLLGAHGLADWPEITAEVTRLGHPCEDALWGLLSVVRWPRKQGRLREAAKGIADVVEHALEGPTEHHPVAHVPLLVVVNDPATWPATVASAAQVVRNTDALLLAWPQPLPAVEVPSAGEHSRQCLEFAEVAPRSALLDEGLLQMYLLVGQTKPIDRAYLFRLILGAVAHHPRGAEYLATLDALLIHGSPAEAAAALGVGERTVSRRLDDIKEITRRDWDDALDRLALSLANICRWLAATTPGAYDAGAFGPLPDLRGPALRDRVSKM